MQITEVFISHLKAIFLLCFSIISLLFLQGFKQSKYAIIGLENKFSEMLAFFYVFQNVWRRRSGGVGGGGGVVMIFKEKRAN